jgi:hypothetical protein
MVAIETRSEVQLTPDLIALFDLIRKIDTHQRKPTALVNVGRWQDRAEVLIEALEDSFETYQRERAQLFNEFPEVGALFSSYGTPEQEQDERFIQSKNGRRIIKLWSIEDIYALPDPTFLISHILETVEVSMLYGMSGTGKTFACLHMGLCIAHGRTWLGRPVKQGIVWYINTEGKYRLKSRFQAWHKEHGLEPTPAFRIIPWAVDLREDFPVLLDTFQAMSEQGEKPTLIVFDNFSMCADVKQNLQEEVTPILKRLNKLSQDQECHVMFIHHTNKEDDFNGAMSFRNHVDTMICLRKEDKNDKNSPVIFSCKKARDREEFSDIKTELKQVTLYTDTQTLEPVTSVVIVASETPIKTPGLKDTIQNVLDILGDRSLLYSEWQKECTKTLKISTATFSRSRTELENKGYVHKYKPEGQRVDHYRKNPSKEENNDS